MNERIREIFARLFVLAVQNKVHFLAFTQALSRSTLVRLIEDGVYDDYYQRDLKDIFFDVTGIGIAEDKSYGVYDDAYWAGYSYFGLHERLKKPFAYLFLKLPLAKMMDLYPVFHEMDSSSLEEVFHREEKPQTILRALCRQRRISLRKLSLATGININTLSKYNASDDALYKGSFQNVMRLARYFDVPASLFWEIVYPLGRAG